MKTNTKFLTLVVLLITILVLFSSGPSFPQDKPDYKIILKDGTKICDLTGDWVVTYQYGNASPQKDYYAIKQHGNAFEGIGFLKFPSSREYMKYHTISGTVDEKTVTVQMHIGGASPWSRSFSSGIDENCSSFKGVPISAVIEWYNFERIR